ncbi:hypothetical protein HHK36_024844 [Tetracentron sinense]|uniref:Uncharacterized protein n=1 Tax=Tetracentron sinense TaxID=13715 RepID=A0A835D7V7_TETSI|nr:hypothetical protein HHK36_024844 [Tetracentron sinense]
MARTAAFYPFIVLTSTKLLHSTLSSSLNFAFYHKHLEIRRSRNPRISICHGKLNASTGEEQEEIEEAFFGGDYEIEDESDEDETESSIDLFFRFLQSMSKKVSKRAKKATRSVLPPAISSQLVSFAVDGVLLLTSLSIMKALLEVVCTLGGTVFIVILLLRVIWATISHFQPSGNSFNRDGTSYGRAQPAT